MYWIVSLLIFSVISSSIIKVVVKVTSWDNIVEYVEIFEHINELPSKSPLHEANELYVLEPLLVAMDLDLWYHHCSL